ncbi:hypothetical protein GD3902_00950 [Geobacillus thermodenitrificans]|nr:hypothetical protein GD3902_00950 [Geobacillus thermodenitrificans]
MFPAPISARMGRKVFIVLKQQVPSFSMSQKPEEMPLPQSNGISVNMCVPWIANFHAEVEGKP